jgi:omega-6 fatty acid desaturase (delta-12 desaturase)
MGKATTQNAPNNNSGDKSYLTSGIPEPLPNNVVLADIIKTLPKEVFHKDMQKAWMQVGITAVSFALSFVLIHYLPWYLLPLAWAFAGTAWTGLFVIGHDCGHLSFARSHLVNDIVGIISFLPLMYPFEPWRIQHNLHHNNTNRLHIDNAWQPFQTEYYESTNETERFIMRAIKGPLWFMASMGHMIKKHFFLEEFTVEQRSRVMVSISAVYIAAGLFFPLMWYFTGFSGIFKFWFMPWVGYHFWMSTFTMIHHTLPHLPFLPDDKWTDAKARLALTVHCEYPYWVERLCHHINVHVPHHVSTGIPSYNLRKAHEALKSHWGKHMTETTFGWPLLKDVISTCHLYHEEDNYVPFSDSDNKKKSQ